MEQEYDTESCAFFVDQYNQEAKHYAKFLMDELRKTGISVLDKVFLPKFLIVLGGDGTMLRAINKYGYTPLFLGLNFGHKGFMLNSVEKDVVQRIVTREFKVRSYPLLSIESDGISRLAVNDLYINRIGGRNCKFNLWVNDSLVAKEVSGDGVVVSTALGSTGYNFAAGGFAIHPSVPCISITPICVHSPIQLKPMVLPLDSKIEIEILEVKQRKIMAWTDGIDFPVSETIKISFSGLYVKLAFWEKESFTERLVSKILKI